MASLPGFKPRLEACRWQVRLCCFRGPSSRYSTERPAVTQTTWPKPRAPRLHFLNLRVIKHSAGVCEGTSHLEWAVQRQIPGRIHSGSPFCKGRGVPHWLEKLPYLWLSECCWNYTPSLLSGHAPRSCVFHTCSSNMLYSASIVF